MTPNLRRFSWAITSVTLAFWPSGVQTEKESENILCLQIYSVMGSIKLPKNHHEVDEWGCMVDSPSPCTTTYYPIPVKSFMYMYSILPLEAIMVLYKTYGVCTCKHVYFSSL